MRPEDYIVSPLIERDEIAYEDYFDPIYKLARQVVGRLRSYLDTDMQVENVLIAHGRTLADFIFAQMMEHYRETPLGEEDYEVRVTHGFTMAQPQPFTLLKGQAARSFREPVRPLSDARRQVFGGCPMLLSATAVRPRPGAPVCGSDRERRDGREMDEAGKGAIPDRVSVGRGL